MNEQLQKLARQAYETVEGAATNDVQERVRSLLLKSLDSVFEEFARLIVAECSSVAFKVAPSDESACDISSAIDKVFGDES